MRRYEDRPLEEGTVETLLEVAHWAPSAGNRQPWFFYVVEDETMKNQLVEVALGQEFIAEAPVIIVVCADPERSAQRYRDRGRHLYCIQDTAAAMQNMLLTAESMGLGTCWIGAFDEEACIRALSLPEHLRPVGMTPVGYPAQSPDARQRRPVDEIVEYIR